MKLRSHGKSVAVWILLAMLILGLGGFGLQSFSGHVKSVGHVGDTPISVDEYARALRAEQQELSQQTGRQITMAQMQAAGLDRQVLGTLIGNASLAEAARTLGVSVGDDQLQQQILKIGAFQNAAGKFDRETYRFTLRQQGYTESQFETSLRADLGRSIIRGTVASGVEMPGAVTEAYARYVLEQRGFTWVEIAESDLPSPVAKPTNAQLQAYYKDNIGQFTSPETRKITYAWLTPDMLKDKVRIDDATLKAQYQAHIDAFRQPEKRLVDRLVYPDMDAARAARARLDAGKASWADLARERGLTTDDTSLGDRTEAELGKAGKAVFAVRTEGTVVGPVETDLGPALFAMNGIIAPQDTSFEDARAELAGEAEADMARREIAKRTETLQDDLAGGATLEDLARDTDMQLGRIDFTAQSKDAITGYEAFHKAAQSVTKDDFPKIERLSDGGVFALRLDGEVAAKPIPFDQVRDKVAAAWHKAEALNAEQARARDIVAAVRSGKSLGAQGLLPATVGTIRRGGYVDGLPGAVIRQVFETDEGQAAPVAANGKVYVVVTTKIMPADLESADSRIVEGQISNRLTRSLANDLLNLYATAVEQEAGFSLDSEALTAVQSQIR